MPVRPAVPGASVSVNLFYDNSLALRVALALFCCLADRRRCAVDQVERVEGLLSELGDVVRELAAASAAAAARAPVRQRLYTVAQLCEAEPALRAGAIRRDLLKREINGLAGSGALVFRGRNILIDRERYLDWISQGR